MFIPCPNQKLITRVFLAGGIEDSRRWSRLCLLWKSGACVREGFYCQIDSGVDTWRRAKFVSRLARVEACLTVLVLLMSGLYVNVQFFRIRSDCRLLKIFKRLVTLSVICTMCCLKICLQLTCGYLEIITLCRQIFMLWFKNNKIKLLTFSDS